MAAQFSLKDLCSLTYFFGIEVNIIKDVMHLTQIRYLQITLQRANMQGAKPYNTPLQSGVQLSKLDETPLSDLILSRIIVGMLQYAIVTRPDLTFSINKVS
jgi:hypothetical protein